MLTYTRYKGHRVDTPRVRGGNPLQFHRAVERALWSFGAALVVHLFSPASIAWGRSNASDTLISVDDIIYQSQKYEKRVKDRFASLPPLPGTFKDLKPTPRPTFHKKRLKSNGIKVILLEDHEVPMVRGIISIKGGSRMAPPSNPALATLSMSVQRSAGSIEHPGEEFNAVLENLSARIESSSGSDALYAGFSCLAEDAQTVIRLVSELLKHPNLSPEGQQAEYAERMLQLKKLQILNSIEHKNDRVQSIPLREAEKLIYGKDSVYVSEPTPEQIMRTSLHDIEYWVSQYENPENTVIGIVGDFESKEMEQILEKYFGDWCNEPNGSVQNVPNPGVPDQSGIQGNIYVIDRPNLRQSTVVMAQPGIALGDPDEIELGVFGEIINSFGGSLFDTIRSRQGLAYSVSAGLESTPIDHKGLFIATAETDKPATLLQSLFDTLETAATKVPSKEEFSRAQEESLNSFVFSIASLQDQLQRAVIYETFGIPENYLYQYIDKVKTTSPEKVHAAAGRLLSRPRETMVTLIIGDSKVITPNLLKMFPDNKIIQYPLSD